MNSNVITCTKRATGIGNDHYNTYEALSFLGDTEEDVNEAILDYLTKRVREIVIHYFSDWFIDKPYAKRRIDARLPFVILARECGTQLSWLDGRNDNEGRIFWWNYYGNEAEFKNMHFIVVDPQRKLVFEGRDVAENYFSKNYAKFTVIEERVRITAAGTEVISLIFDEMGFINNPHKERYLICKELDTVDMTYKPIVAARDKQSAYEIMERLIMPERTALMA